MGLQRSGERGTGVHVLGERAEQRRDRRLFAASADQVQGVRGGDDLGDVPAFRAVARLRGDGIAGLAVCSGSAEVSALTELADLVVDGPDGAVALLDALAAAMAGTN